MGAIKDYKLVMLVLPHTDLNEIGNIIYNHGAPEGASFTGGKTHRTYDAKLDKNIDVEQYEWSFRMDCERARELEDALQAEPTAYRFLLLNMSYTERE